jgi:hypothetical protein
MKPNFLKRFVKKLTRERVVPTGSNRVAGLHESFRQLNGEACPNVVCAIRRVAAQSLEETQWEEAESDPSAAGTEASVRAHDLKRDKAWQ